MISSETTSTGRRPSCSRPCTGERSTKKIWPRLGGEARGILESVQFGRHEFPLDGDTLGADDRIGGHLYHFALESKRLLVGDVLLEGKDYQTIEIAAEIFRSIAQGVRYQLRRESDAAANTFLFDCGGHLVLISCTQISTLLGQL